jgi:molybdate transport system regulatory protein
MPTIKKPDNQLPVTSMNIKANNSSHGRIVSASEADQCLDTAQLGRLERSFREWADDASRADARFSRQRILIIFLLIRYTGAKLSEVLALDLINDIAWAHNFVRFRDITHNRNSDSREVQISEALSREIKNILTSPSFCNAREIALNVDHGFVRRKFYERAEACRFPKRKGGPEMIRKARAVELMRSNMPLPVVQVMMGHSTPNLTSAYVNFSKEEIKNVAKIFMERESVRKTSARNSFFGKIQDIRKGDIQTIVTLKTFDGFTITTMITNDSAERLGLGPGGLITAEVKAPWIILQSGVAEPACSAENRFKGVLTRIIAGKINTECVVRISETTEVCAVISTAAGRKLNLHAGDEVWVLFNCFSVVLHSE